MGCNYYLYTDICPHCQRHEKKIHIGKSSGGWTFSFRGYRNNWQEPENIRSYKDWLEYLSKKLVSMKSLSLIKDEEGDIVTLSEFMELVESKRNEKFNHTTYCQKERLEHATRDCWLDEKGNSFSDCEFS